MHCKFILLLVYFMRMLFKYIGYSAYQYFQNTIDVYSLKSRHLSVYSPPSSVQCHSLFTTSIFYYSLFLTVMFHSAFLSTHNYFLFTTTFYSLLLSTHHYFLLTTTFYSLLLSIHHYFLLTTTFYSPLLSTH